MYTPFSPLSLDSSDCQQILTSQFGSSDPQFPCLKQKKAVCIVHPTCDSHQESRKKNKQNINKNNEVTTEPLSITSV